MEGKIRELVQKVGIFRLILVVLAGVMLLVLSIPEQKQEQGMADSKEQTADTVEAAFFQEMEAYIKRQERATEEILSKVEGIGEVKVMLTLASSEEKVTLQDNSITENDATQEDGSGGSKMDSGYKSEEETVLVKKDGEESPYVVQIHSPVIEGVVVVAEGISSGKKETEIIEAIQALFSIEPHKIKVMKME